MYTICRRAVDEIKTVFRHVHDFSAGFGVLQLHDVDILRPDPGFVECGPGSIHRGAIRLLQCLAWREDFEGAEATGFQYRPFHIDRVAGVLPGLICPTQHQSHATLGG